MPITPTTRRAEQEEQGLKIRLGYTAEASQWYENNKISNLRVNIFNYKKT